MPLTRPRRGLLFVFTLALAAGVALAAQNPLPQTTAAATAQRGGGGRGGRGGIQAMTLSTSAWADGAQIPVKHAQPGHDVSPPLTWSDPPDGTASFTLVVHDLDAPIANGSDDVLHWLVWNIPATSRALPEGLPQGPQLPDGLRQISATGPYYRGPAAPASGPVHHYVFELFALDTTIDVAPVGATQALSAAPVIRAAVVTAMAGHIRGKAVMVGLFRRAP
jgi:Raf kinase inhibitor-like YbhB/YbcL family protein